MEFATGAMSSLLPKLGELLTEEYNLKESVKKGIEDLKAELESMQAALVKVSSVPLDELDPQVNIWANEVRELSYAIEDSLDSFVTRVQGVEPTKPKIKHLLKKVRNKFTKFSARHEIAADIKDIEIQVRKIKERYDSYKINDIVANHSATAVDPRLPALYNKISDLVGTDEPIEELMKVLSEGVETSQNNLKIVSVVGFGGLGKTTLAKALYDKLSKTYQCQGFVPVGQNQCTKKVLRDILLQLDMKLYKAAATMDEMQLIDQLQKFLAGKRYFMVIDDLWDVSTWETIKWAFMDSHPKSRIIITTRIVDVATNAGAIYHMKPLSDANSQMLFHTRTSAEGVSQDNQPGEAIRKILKKCGGVPLAIITIASLLVGKPSADWSKVYDAIGFGHEKSEVIQNTRKILSFSYYDLAPDLKTCLLYLSMFPEDYFIQKKSLIWRWVIEGFVPDKEGIGSYEQGEIYFNKLVNKSMIRFTEPDDPVDISQGGCRVHDMVLDLIRTMSSDINFVTIHDTEQLETCSRGKQTSRVRRLALHGRSAEHNTNLQMEHVRSFNAIMCGDSKMPLLSSFKVLRVLVIEECDFFKGHSLEHLGKLVQLRYLGLVETDVKLPEGIGHDLKFLEILDVRGGLISELPPSVGELQKLRCLWADKGTIMKGEIGKLTKLEELQLHNVGKCPNFFMGLGKLTNLRVLIIEFNECGETEGKALVGSLCNLHKIQTLSIIRNYIDGFMDLYKKGFHVRGSSLEDLVPSSKLHLFELPSIIIPRMPTWVNYLRVPLLSDLWLYVEVVEARDLQTLGRLPSLLLLVLNSEEEKSISYTFGSDEFQKLERLLTNHVEITLGEGALPRLEGLLYSASAGKKDSLVPWKNSCPLLDEVTCLLDCANSSRMEVKAAKAVLRKAERTHPIEIHIQNYSSKAGRLIDALKSILHGLDRPDGEEITADQRGGLRRMISSLETLLRDAAEPRVGRYGEQELRGFVTKFKSLLHHDAGTDQEEEADNSDGMDNYYYDDYTDTDDDDNKEEVLRRWRHRWRKPPTLLQYQQVTRCIELAGSCRKPKPKDRPSIKEIIDLLTESKDGHTGQVSILATADVAGGSGTCAGWDMNNLMPSDDTSLDTNNLMFQLLHGHWWASASSGTMRALVEKLDMLLLAPPQGCSSRSVKDGMRLLKDDVEEISSYLDEISEVEDPPPVAKCWMNEARDLSYDIEDYIDSLLFVPPDCLNSNRHNRKQKKWKKNKKNKKLITSHFKIPKRFKWCKQRTYLSQVSEHGNIVPPEMISQFRTYIQDAIERHDKYNLHCCSTLGRRRFLSTGRMLPTPPYEEAAEVVLDSRMNEFINSQSLVVDEAADQQPLKVVSILGPGCLGKTTLARVLYNRIGMQFDCRAFIQVSKKPNMKRLFCDLFSQIHQKKQPLTANCNKLGISDNIRKYLQVRRYLIVIDDLWDASVWNIIKYAFPEDNRGSRIIITTQIEHVALACCCDHSEQVFEMKPLDVDHSRGLFFKRLFGSESECPEEFKQISNEIVDICGGLPLATINIASHLANQHTAVSMDLLAYTNGLLRSYLWSNSTSERTRQVLNLSYDNLPHYLKTCLLYLIMYSEGSIICKDDLVKQWVAEGFIATRKGNEKDQDMMEKAAGMYFDELIDRRFIQPCHISDSNKVLSCTVHEVVRDLIAHKSAEDNFIVAVDYNRKNIALSHKVRRLSLAFGDAKYAKTPENIKKSQVRSLRFFGLFECMPCITEFKILRVLNLQLSDHRGDHDPIDLTAISELFQLRYLKIASDVCIKLPNHMRGLKYLETLDVMDATRVTGVPWDIIYLPRLFHLSLPVDTNLLDWIGSMSDSVISQCSLGMLNYLQDLHLTSSSTHPSCHLERSMEVLGSLIGGLYNLKTLVVAHGSSVKNIVGRGAPKVIIPWDHMAPPPLLQRFELTLHNCCMLSQIPPWVEKHGNLCILKIPVRELKMGCVDILRGLHALTDLSLYVESAPLHMIIFCKAGFSVLKYFELRFSTGIACLKFEAYAMPNLLKLQLVFINAISPSGEPLRLYKEQQQRGTAVSIEHMPTLKEISVKVGGFVGLLKYDLRTFVSNHPSNPTINMQLLGYSPYVDAITKQKEQAYQILEEEYGTLEEEQDGIVEEGPDRIVEEEQAEPSSKDKKRKGKMDIYDKKLKRLVQLLDKRYFGSLEEPFLTLHAGVAPEHTQITGGSDVERKHMFDKVLGPSDVGWLNRLVIPKQHAEKYFPLDAAANEKGLLLSFEDRGGKLWRFRYSYWNSSQSYVMTKGWSRFVKEKCLDAGDTVSFSGGIGEAVRDRLFIDWKRRAEVSDPHGRFARLQPNSPQTHGSESSHDFDTVQMQTRNLSEWPQHGAKSSAASSSLAEPQSSLSLDLDL